MSHESENLAGEGDAVADTGEIGKDTTAPAEASADLRALEGEVEALLFSSEVPLPARRLADLTGSSKGKVLEAVDRLNVHYGESARAFRITEIAGGQQMVTVPEFAGVLGGLHKQRIPTRLSRAALETLAIIAFKQPVTRAEVDRIRGVSASDGVLRHLIERKAVKIAGRAEAPGRPLLYGTTREFLGYFGLAQIADLPKTEELEAMLAGEIAAPEGAGADLFGLDDDPEALDGAPDAPVVGGPSPEDDREADEEPAGQVIMKEEEEAHSSEEARTPEPLDEQSHSGEESDDREGVPAT